jgi:hypothetical protein
MLLSFTQIKPIIELHIILNLLLQQFESDNIFTLKTYILRSGFKANSMCSTWT